MRSVLDPKRHYKKGVDPINIPSYSQTGRVIQGTTESVASRISKKDQRKTLVEETMKSGQNGSWFKRKYGEIQVHKGSGRKAYYNTIKKKRA